MNERHSKTNAIDRKEDRQITIVTATFNVSEHVANLAESLRRQTNSGFDWIVIDGGSSDGTLTILERYSDVISKIVSESDFGIYDALNKGIKSCETPYYLVMGADDILRDDAIANYLAAIRKTNADLISAEVVTTSGIKLFPNRGQPHRYGHQAYVSQHSVGTLIKKSLHDVLGYYSRHYPIAADRHFILKVIGQKNYKVAAENFVAGTFSSNGVSGSAIYNSLLDISKVDYALSSSKRFSALKSTLRLLLNLHRF